MMQLSLDMQECVPMTLMVLIGVLHKYLKLPAKLGACILGCVFLGSKSMAFIRLPGKFRTIVINNNNSWSAPSACVPGPKDFSCAAWGFTRMPLGWGSAKSSSAISLLSNTPPPLCSPPREERAGPPFFHCVYRTLDLLLVPLLEGEDNGPLLFPNSFQFPLVLPVLPRWLPLLWTWEEVIG